MRIVIAGGSGFIGEKLTKHFTNQGHDVIILSRTWQEEKLHTSYVTWLNEHAQPEMEIKKANIFINLAGVSINDGRWTKKHQQAIYNSRMTATNEVLRIIQALPTPPKVLINASAIGIYPASETTEYKESSTAVADDFLGKTVYDWEQLAMTAENEGVRVACMRFGVILGNEGGALPPMLTPYRLFVGGTVGSGRQWLSWVHVDDVIRAIDFAIHQPNLSGPINVTAPAPKRMKDFGQTIGKVMDRPHWFPAPSFMMRLLLGQKSDLVLKGQYVLPERLVENHFQFTYPTLDVALHNLLNSDV